MRAWHNRLKMVVEVYQTPELEPEIVWVKDPGGFQPWRSHLSVVKFRVPCGRRVIDPTSQVRSCSTGI